MAVGARLRCIRRLSAEKQAEEWQGSERGRGSMEDWGGLGGVHGGWCGMGAAVRGAGTVRVRRVRLFLGQGAVHRCMFALGWAWVLHYGLCVGR